MAKSILQDEKCCYLCESHNWLEEHHVFGAANRKNSEKYGLKVYLCHSHHNEPPDGVHHNKAVRLHLQTIAQKKAMETYEWTEDDFREIFGKNYL